MEMDRNGLEILDRSECLRLLGTITLGRIGLTAGALPRILPVNFRQVGDRILIRTGAGSKLEAATRNAVVAFETDDFDPLDHSGWSVLVTGVARDINDEDLDELERFRLTGLAPPGDGRVVVISTGLVSGRRIVPGLTAARALPHQGEP
jgi:nitroimidazol reductase NimA-like FMN-containing flavoprotein (pyridoxamine 5'-phosphate oxidase superfamily)